MEQLNTLIGQRALASQRPAFFHISIDTQAVTMKKKQAPLRAPIASDPNSLCATAPSEIDVVNAAARAKIEMNTDPIPGSQFNLLAT
jgi:hypothetical protein